MGSCPDWYDLIQAAKYLGVPPWDLLERPEVWRIWARMAEKAEHEATKAKNRRKQTARTKVVR